MYMYTLSAVSFHTYIRAISALPLVVNELESLFYGVIIAITPHASLTSYFCMYFYPKVVGDAHVYSLIVRKRLISS
jgi:hypothetical protein